MSTIPSLALIPSGVKASKVYSVLPTDGTGDFTFARAGALPSYNATRVNSEGLIEEVLSNVPRLNYPMIDGVVSGCPSLLLEPQRTNLLTYSEDFSNVAWNKINSTINSNQTISPKGDLTADLLSATTTTGSGSYFIDVLFVTPSQKYTYSIFAKKSNSDYFAFVIVDGANVVRQYYNVSDGLVGITNNTGSPIVENINIENYGNGWYRCSLTVQSLNSAVEVRNYVIQNDGIATAPIGSEIFLWGIQAEQGTYPTSYIPTVASTVTRVAETVSKTGLSNYINSQEGVFYVELKGISNSSGLSQRGISLGDNTFNNRVIITHTINSEIYCYILINGVQIYDAFINIDVSENHKIAVSWKNNNFATYVNGSLVERQLSGGIFSSNILSKISFDTGLGTDNYIGNVKNLQVFNTALSDLEIETLTSYTSFEEMALALNYTIEITL